MGTEHNFMDAGNRPIAFDHDCRDATWIELNLNQRLRSMGFPDKGVNQLLDPLFCNEAVRRVAQLEGYDFTYGGHGEDRSFMWRGHYHNPLKMQHLGTDYNVPALTRVAAPHGFRVINVWRDPDQNGGWGGQVIGELDREYRGATHVIFGHLKHSALPEVGEYMPKGKVFGLVGEIAENGGWYEHLHVQMLGRRVVEHMAFLTAIDGYGTNGVDISEDYPDAAPWMSGLAE